MRMDYSFITGWRAAHKYGSKILQCMDMYFQIASHEIAMASCAQVNYGLN